MGLWQVGGEMVWVGEDRVAIWAGGGGVEAVFVVGQPACSILGEGRGLHLLCICCGQWRI